MGSRVGSQTCTHTYTKQAMQSAQRLLGLWVADARHPGSVSFFHPHFFWGGGNPGKYRTLEVKVDVVTTTGQRSSQHLCTPGSQGAGALCQPPPPPACSTNCGLPRRSNTPRHSQCDCRAPPAAGSNQSGKTRVQPATRHHQRPQAAPQARSTCGNSHSSPIACSPATLEPATAVQESGHDG